MRWRRASRSEPLPEPGGEVHYDWPEGGGDPFDASADDSDPYQHHVPGAGPRGTYAALDGHGGERGPDGRWVSHQHDSYAAALAEACTMTDRRALVVSVLTTKDWH